MSEDMARNKQSNELDGLKLRGCRISLEIRHPFGHAYRIVEWLDRTGCVVRQAVGPHTTATAVIALIQSAPSGSRHRLRDDGPEPPASLRRRGKPSLSTWQANQRL